MSTPHPHPHGELHNVDTAHEESDINIRAIVTFTVMLAGITIAIQVAMYLMFIVLAKIEDKADPIVSPMAKPAIALTSPLEFPEPRLQQTPWTDLKKLRADEASYLHGYGWVDQQAGVARIPIEKAKALLLQKGLPVSPAPAGAAEGTHVAATGESSGGRNLAAGGADTSSPSAPAAPPAGAQGASGATGATGASGATGTPGAAKKPGGGV